MIVNSLLDTDFYKFTMGQVIFRNYQDVSVMSRFQCRTPGVPLAQVINLDELDAELTHVTKLRLNNSELHYLRGTNEYGARMFDEDYLQFLRDLQLPKYFLSFVGDNIKLDFVGPWSKVTYWETFALSIINELYYRTLMSKGKRFFQETLEASAICNLSDKVETLRACPGLTFTDFGTRRRFSRGWQDYIVGTLAEEMPEQFKGTSNVALAMKYGLTPMGTSAHEMFMVGAGIAPQTDEGIRESHNDTLRVWWKQYGQGLSVALTDTFGSGFFFEDFSRSQAQSWKGLRHDSGDPLQFGRKAIDFYRSHGVDPKDKMIVFSDGLSPKLMVYLYRKLNEEINVTFGWGTNLTNDFGFDPLSLVVKPVEANGNGLVKLSDNLNKAVGTKEDIARYKRIFRHNHEERAVCIS